MTQIPKGRLVKGPYKPIWGTVSSTFQLLYCCFFFNQIIEVLVLFYNIMVFTDELLTARAIRRCICVSSFFLVSAVIKTCAMYFLKRRINLFNDWKNTRVIPCDPTSSRMSGGWLQYSVECWLQCLSGIALCAIPPGQEARAARISQNCWWRLGHVEIREDLIENSGHHPAGLPEADAASNLLGQQCTTRINCSHWDGGCSTGRVAFGHLEALGSNRDIQRAVHAAQRFDNFWSHQPKPTLDHETLWYAGCW